MNVFLSTSISPQRLSGGDSEELKKEVVNVDNHEVKNLRRSLRRSGDNHNTAFAAATATIPSDVITGASATSTNISENPVLAAVVEPINRRRRVSKELLLSKPVLLYGMQCIYSELL